MARPAAAAPLATTMVTCSADTSGDSPDPSSFGPLPVALSTSCDARDAGTDVFGVPYFNQAVSIANTGFGPGPPRVGVAEVSAEALSKGGLDRFASVSAGAHVIYYLEIENTAVAPFPVPMFPTYFEARGEGTATSSSEYGEASFLARATLGGEVLGVEGESSEHPSENFDKEIRIQLEPNGPANPFYTIELLAYCGASVGGRDPGDGVGCSAAVDPVVRFDQETFDALYGSSSFPLEDYYRFKFGENVPAPEPVHALLVLTGGFVLTVVRRRRA